MFVSKDNELTRYTYKTVLNSKEQAWGWLGGRTFA